MSDFILPSGATVNVDRPDFSACVDAEDLMELKYALSEKIIEIELQIDLHEAAFTAGHPNGVNGDKPWDWLPRAKAALKWTKLYRDEAQNRQGRIAAIDKARRQAATTQCVIDVLRELLPAAKFEALIEAANTLSAKRTD
jgi:hypothetical protein